MKNQLLSIFLVLISIHLSYTEVLTPKETELDEKLIKCLEIFNRLKQAQGILPSEPPHLRLVKELPKSKFKLAMATNATKEIFLEEAVYDMCQESLGENADNGLAYLLAHELAHITQEHNVRHQFIEQFSKGMNQDTGLVNLVTRETGRNRTKTDSLLKAYKKVERSYQIRKNEAEADLEAGFTCYLAGYNTKVAGPLFLEQAYRKFNIDPKGGDYASLADRQFILKNTAKSLDSLIRVFRLANYLSISDNLTEAIDCYDYVVKKYPSKEILNNVGVVGLNHIAKDLCVPSIIYALPLTLDLQEYALENDRAVMTDEELKLFLEAKRIELNNKLAYLDQSITYFDKAASIDRTYHIAELNKSIAFVFKHFLKDNYKEVEKYKEDDLYFAEAAALKAKQIVLEHKAQDKLAASNVYVMLAILKQYQNSAIDAKTLLNKAIEIMPDNDIALVNKAIFEGNKDTLKTIMFGKNTMDLCGEEELLFGTKTLIEVENEFANSWDLEYEIKVESGTLFKKTTVINYIENDDFELYKFSRKRGLRVKDGVLIFLPKESYKHSTVCDIEVGSSRSDIKDEYGNPINTIQTNEGSVLHYQNMIFNLDEDSKVRYWLNYKRL